MPSFKSTTLALLLLSGSLAAAPAGAVPAGIAAPGQTIMLAVHAEGAQIYECKVGADGKLTFAFREPIATLMLGNQTVGRHFAGPTWEHNDGSAIVGTVTGSVPGETANDIPWLRLEVTSHRGSGILAEITTVQRMNTSGGKLEGPCDKAGMLRSVPYSANYVFLRKE
jgi:hypothetical protein